MVNGETISSAHIRLIRGFFTRVICGFVVVRLWLRPSSRQSLSALRFYFVPQTLMVVSFQVRLRKTRQTTHEFICVHLWLIFSCFSFNKGSELMSSSADRPARCSRREFLGRTAVLAGSIAG